MTSVLHIIDRNCDETQLQVLELLRGRLDSPSSPHRIAAVDSVTMERAIHVRAPVERTPRFVPSRFVNYSPSLLRAVNRRRVDVVHAWGVEAAAVCQATLRGYPLVLTLLDPESTADAARWIRSFPAGATVVAGSHLILSRLAAAGLDPARIVVVRGAVDFGAINRARKENLRVKVAGDAKPVVLLSGPASEAGGQRWGIWAAGIIQHLHPSLKVMLPYQSPVGDRLTRWVHSMRMGSMLIRPDPRLSWSELVTCADVFLQPATDEVCIEPIANAMAAGIPVVAAAVRSIAEMIADRHNGLLVKNAAPKLVSARLLTAIEDTALVRSVTDTARGQAFEVFGLRAFADNYRRVYENLLEGRSISDGVKDTAMVA